MADVTVEAAVYTGIDGRDALHGPYWTSPSVGYIVLQESFDPIDVYKTADSGATWVVQDGVNNPSNASNVSMSAYFDQETPGNSGTLIHIAWMQGGGGHYIAFDTSDDTYGTDITVDALTVSGTAQDGDVSVTVAKGGRVHCIYRGGFEADTENTDHSHRSSSDGFASNNESEASPYTSDEEVIKLLPGSATNTADICAVVFDAVNQDLEFWKFDASANSWSVTAIDESIEVTGAEARDAKTFFDCSTRHSDEHVLVVYWNDFHQSTGDFRSVDITPATPTITQKTNIDNNTDDSFYSALLINQQNDYVYVAYLGTDAGDEFLTSSIRCYFKLSTDGMGAWGTEQDYGTQNDDQRAVSAGRTVGDAGGRFMPAWFNDDLNDVLVNDGNDVEIAAAGGGGNALPMMMQMNQFDGGQTSFI